VGPTCTWWIAAKGQTNQHVEETRKAYVKKCFTSDARGILLARKKGKETQKRGGEERDLGVFKKKFKQWKKRGVDVTLAGRRRGGNASRLTQQRKSAAGIRMGKNKGSRGALLQK